MKSSEIVGIIVAVVGVSVAWLMWAILGNEVAQYFSRDPQVNGGTWGDTFGALNALLSALGWIALLFTLQESRRAASAAVESNKIAAASNRAWIKIERVSLPDDELTFLGPTIDPIIALQIEAENVGDTPAFEVVYRLSASMFRGPVDEDEFRSRHDRTAILAGPEKLVFPKEQVSEGMSFLIPVATGGVREADADLDSSQNALVVVVGVEAIYRVQGDKSTHSSGKFYLVWLTTETLRRGWNAASIAKSLSSPPWAT